MQFDAILLPPRRADSIAPGYWHDRTINEDLDACLAECPDKLALTAVRVEAGDVRRFTYREMATLADRIAVGLSRLGVGRNDVVAMQLPNWWHFSLLYLACSRIGAVLNPLMPIFRERELSFMLRHGEAKVFVVPKRFRNFDHEAMARAIIALLTDERARRTMGAAGLRRVRERFSVDRMARDTLRVYEQTIEWRDGRLAAGAVEVSGRGAKSGEQ